MGYLHIDGKGMQASGGSRFNAFEAETIAAWLAAHKEEIERNYGEPLHKVVGLLPHFRHKSVRLNRHYESWILIVVVMKIR